MLRLTIWMNHPSFHQSDLFKVLSENPDVDLKVIFAKGLSSERREAGWHEGFSSFEFSIIDRSIRKAIRRAWLQRDRIHIVNGLWGEPSFAAALMMLAVTRSKFAIYSEVPDRHKSVTPDPNLASRSIFKEFIKLPFGKLIAPRAAGILSVSHFAADFFSRLGVSRNAIYPFGYFRSKAPGSTYSHSEPNPCEIVFAGRLIKLKGIDLLLEAMRPLFESCPELRLALIGTGELLEPLKQQVLEQGLETRVRFEGVVPSFDILLRLAAADLAVLPSRGDGWGMVVNEALSVGVPVIVSDRCGAADLVRNGFNGYVFRSDDVDDLRKCLTDFLSRREEWPRFRANAAATGASIAAEAAAPYLLDCLKHMTGLLKERPEPPWKVSGDLVQAY